MIRAISVFAVLGCVWFASGYLLYNYVFPSLLAYFVFPLVAFGIVPCIEGILKSLLVVILVVSTSYAVGYFFGTTLGFTWMLAYVTFPVVLLAFVALTSFVFPPVEEGVREDGSK